MGEALAYVPRVPSTAGFASGLISPSLNNREAERAGAMEQREGNEMSTADDDMRDRHMRRGVADDTIRFTVEASLDGGLCAFAEAICDGHSGGIYTQGNSPYELIGMMADAAQCMIGAADVDFEIVWPDEPPPLPLTAWPNVITVSVRGRQ